MATLKALQDKIVKLQAQAEAIARKESSAVFEKIHDLMKKHGLTADDIASHFRKSGPGRKAGAAKHSTTRASAAKYTNPKTGATWTGHGRAPAWIANVKDRSKFLTDESSASTAVVHKAAKPGNYVRGPQAPMYQDPESGATWSGRGRAPAWLADVKDRTAYLIEKAGTATKKAAAKKSAKKTTAKKVSVKKAAAKKSAPTAKKAAKKAVAKKSAAKRAPVKKAAANEISIPMNGQEAAGEITAA